MKNKLLLIGTAILFLASCRNDDSSETSNNKIIGKWFYSKQVIVSGGNGTVLNTSNAYSCEKKSFFEFTSDKVTEYWYVQQSNQCVVDYSGTSLYHIDNNILYYEDNASMKIESLSGSELVFQVDLYDYNGDGQKDKFLEYYYK